MSRESFLYLSEFYIGEVAPEDRPLVPVLEASAAKRLSMQALILTPLSDSILIYEARCHGGAESCTPMRDGAFVMCSVSLRRVFWSGSFGRMLGFCENSGTVTGVPAAAAGVQRLPHAAWLGEVLQELLTSALGQRDGATTHGAHANVSMDASGRQHVQVLSGRPESAVQ